MAKTRKIKETEVKRLIDNFQGAKAVVFATFKGLTVAKSRELRNKLRQEKVAFRVSKKTLLKKALEIAKVTGLDLQNLQGNVAIAFGKEDEVAPAKILNNFTKDNEQMHLEFGLLEGQFLTLERLKKLAELPSKLKLLAKVVGTIKAPLSGLINVLVGNLRGLVTVLKAIQEKK